MTLVSMQQQQQTVLLLLLLLVRVVRHLSRPCLV
jgi:hypothetical protein